MVSEKAKTLAIIAHITIIGWVIALVLNNDDKEEFASFYIRQSLGIFLIGIAVTIVNTILFMIPFLGLLLFIGVLAILIASLIWAANGEKRALPVLGEQFQEWFKSL